ncbi:MAG: DUF1192 family protein [Pseudomonadota bacterium]
MFEQEPEPEKKIDLERLSVEDLKERIDALKAEIAACEAELRKNSLTNLQRMRFLAEGVKVF